MPRWLTSRRASSPTPTTAMAPIIVMPDENGSFTNDTECVDGPRGNAETYITVDVPNVHAHPLQRRDGQGFGRDRRAVGRGDVRADADTAPPDEYPVFADYSGLTSPTVEETVDPPADRSGCFSAARRRPTTSTTRCICYARDSFRGSPAGSRWAPTTARRWPRSERSFRSPEAPGSSPAREVPGEGHDFSLVGAGVSRVAALPVLAARADRETRDDRPGLLGLSPRRRRGPSSAQLPGCCRYQS